MKFLIFLIFLSFATQILCHHHPDHVVNCTGDGKNPQILIVGAGAAGIAAASRLYENGFKNVKILEAENRIGGRIYSPFVGPDRVDMGSQWVHGEEGNAVYDLAWPLGLLEKSSDPYHLTMKIYASSGVVLSTNISNDIMLFVNGTGEATEEEFKKLKTGTRGEFVELKFAEYFRNHPEIPEDLHKPIIENMDLITISLGEADWYSVPARGAKHYKVSPGDQAMNWKGGVFSIILDILMKKYPNPEQELPVLNNTLLNTKVTKISYNVHDCDAAIVSTSDDQHIVADHVIFTGSLGVLKAKYRELFDPALPADKINSIKNLRFGHVGKICMYYKNPWWSIEHDVGFWDILWTESDRRKLQADVKKLWPTKRWMLEVTYMIRIEHRPKIICIYATSNNTLFMQHIPENLVRSQAMEFLRKFYGNSYNFTEPDEVLKSSWDSDNFRGTYSYPDWNSETTNASYHHVGRPIMKNDKPILQFAGEATDASWSTTQGAINSGWREADRIISLYLKN